MPSMPSTPLWNLYPANIFLMESHTTKIDLSRQLEVGARGDGTVTLN